VLTGNVYLTNVVPPVQCDAHMLGKA